jgi:hypothetical protein
MSENIQKSPSLKQMVDAFTHLKQKLEYFERHIQNSKNQEVRKEYFRTGYRSRKCPSPSY